MIEGRVGRYRARDAPVVGGQHQRHPRADPGAGQHPAKQVRLVLAVSVFVFPDRVADLGLERAGPELEPRVTHVVGDVPKQDPQLLLRIGHAFEPPVHGALQLVGEVRPALQQSLVPLRDLVPGREGRQRGGGADPTARRTVALVAGERKGVRGPGPAHAVLGVEPFGVAEPGRDGPSHRVRRGLFGQLDRADVSTQRQAPARMYPARDPLREAQLALPHQDRVGRGADLHVRHHQRQRGRLVVDLGVRRAAVGAHECAVRLDVRSLAVGTDRVGGHQVQPLRGAVETPMLCPRALDSGAGDDALHDVPDVDPGSVRRDALVRLVENDPDAVIDVVGGPNRRDGRLVGQQTAQRLDGGGRRAGHVGRSRRRGPAYGDQREPPPLQARRHVNSPARSFAPRAAERADCCRRFAPGTPRSARRPAKSASGARTSERPRCTAAS